MTGGLTPFRSGGSLFSEPGEKNFQTTIGLLEAMPVTTINTLTSLAILRVAVDAGRDYIDHLRPFVLQALSDSDIPSFTPLVVTRHIRMHFGLEIPERTVEIVLRRLTRHRVLKRENHAYHRIGTLPDPGIGAKQANASRHINAVVHGLREFSKESIGPIDDDQHAIAAISAFLGEFGIQCLRAYLADTAIPQLGGTHKADVVLVSNYVQQVQRTQPERFDSFMVVVQGHMLANALLCPDLQYAPKSYRRVVFYFDTPLLVRRLGASGEAKQDAVRELIALIKELGGRVGAFSHSIDELRKVLHGAADFLARPEGRGDIVWEARKRGTSRSDLLLLAETIDRELLRAGIDVVPSPAYFADFQIDETVFERVLDDEVSYYNPRARQYDVNSVRSIYVLRKRGLATSIETAGAVFVTPNHGFAKAAWVYGAEHESSREVSSVISDVTLANVAWLKTPMKPPSVPTTQVLAFAYAALQPSPTLLAKYLKEAEKLQARGSISERDLQLLRSSPKAYSELMDRTLGDEDLLTEVSVQATLAHVTEEIRREESERLASEQNAHRRTQEALESAERVSEEVVKTRASELAAEREAHEKTQRELESTMAKSRELTSKVYWRCRRSAEIWARALAIVLATVVVGGGLYGLGVRASSPVVGGALALASTLLVVVSLLNFVGPGISVIGCYSGVRKVLLEYLLRRKSRMLGLDFGEFLATGRQEL